MVSDRRREQYTERRFQSFEFWAESLRSIFENFYTKFSETDRIFGFPVEKYRNSKKKSDESKFV